MDLNGSSIVWLRVGAGLASLAGDASLWAEPAAVRKALLELLGVFPATHVEIDLEAVRARPGGDGAWDTMLTGGGDGRAYVAELWEAVGDGLQGRAAWGLALPDPRAVAAGEVDAEKGMLKSGLLLGGFLRHVRETSLAFVTVDLAPEPPSGMERALAPALRNGQLYGWSRAIAVGTVAEVERWSSVADVTLLRDGNGPAPAGDRPVLGGLSSAFWAEGRLRGTTTRARWFGVLPADVTAKDVVERGRILREALGE